jgi:multidrug efflux system membrane fusion protein
MAAGLRKKKFTRFVLGGVLIAIVGTAVIYVRDNKNSARRDAPQARAGNAQQAGPVPVDVVTAEKTSFPVYLRGLGSIQSFNMVTVRSRVDGEIVKVNFKEGQMVAEGDLLVQIDPRPYQATLDQASAKRGQDQATLENAKLDLQRVETLIRSSSPAASRQQLDTQTSLVHQLTAQVAADEASIRSAQVQLDYTSIRAPITGRAGFALITLGNVVHASDATGIVTITQTDPIAAVFTAPEDQLQAISDALSAGGVEVAALSSDGGESLATGSLSVINNQVDQATGTIQLKATFVNQDNKLWPGQSVSTQLLLRTLQDVVVIPGDGVQTGPNGYYAYVIGKDNKAAMKNIKIGPMDNGQAVIFGGIEPADRVVVSGQYRLQNGTVVAAKDRTPGDHAPDQHSQNTASATTGTQPLRD